MQKNHATIMNRRQKLACRILRVFCYKKPYFEKSYSQHFENGLATSIEYFARLGNKVNFTGKTILDIGCGVGSTCFYMAFNGAVRVVGIDIRNEVIEYARLKLMEHPELMNTVSFSLPIDLPKEQFDIVLSKDSFEHYSNPEEMIKTMKQYLKPNGIIVIGFSPLWKSPVGGHIEDLTFLPWAHLLFPEPVIMQELRLYWRDEKLTSFNKVASGLNKMTYKRFLNIIERNGLEFEYLRTNITTKPKERSIFRILRVISLFPPLREYFIVNVYGILRVKDQTRHRSIPCK